MPDAAHTPVIVGVGEVKDQPQDRATGQEPAALIETALRRAQLDAGADAGANLLARLDSLDVVNVISWPYDDLPGLLAERLGAGPGWRRHGEIGGHTPVQFLHEAASRIARGEASVAAVCGGEATHTATWARRTGTSLGWTQPHTPVQTGTDWLPARNRDYIHPLARAHGVTEPITVYPLYETAVQALWGQTPEEGRAESAALGSALSAIAAGNPTAWIRARHDPQAISAMGPANRPVAWPYSKLMVANPAVNQAGAILLTSLEVARAAGIPEERLIYLHAGAAASEPRDWMARPRLDGCPAQDAVLKAMLEASGGVAPTICELYTCFPVVPKMARRVLGLPATTPISVTGGLTFHGAPFNSTMVHAAAMMVRRLREAAHEAGGRGLLYGQGGHLTSHHALLLGRDTAPPGAMLRPYDRNAAAAARRQPAPAIAIDTLGAARLEAFTVLFNPDGTAAHGTAVVRLADGARTLGRVPAEDGATLARLMADGVVPIGHMGRLTRGTGPLLRWVA